MQWKLEPLWVKRNSRGVIVGIRELPPAEKEKATAGTVDKENN